MKKTLIFAMAMALGISATAFAANPFSDVPQGHWAYGAIAELAAEGVVNGYPDGTFKGNQMMTRYEMAQIVAKALAKGGINNNDALVAEFADELDNLGVRVAKLEKKSDNVKITGSLRYRYFAHDSSDNYGDGMYEGDNYRPDTSELRTRLGIAGSINDNWTYMALIENDKNFGHDIDGASDDTTEFRRAWLKGSIGQVGVLAGRWDYTVLNGNVFDDEMDGACLSFAAGDVDVALAYGREDATDVYDDTANIDNDGNLFIATVGTTFGVVDANVAYYNQENSTSTTTSEVASTEDASIWSLGLSGEITKDLILGGTYIKASDENANGDDSGYALSLKYKSANKKVVGSYGLYAMYNDQPNTTYICPTTDATTFDRADGGFKGYTLGADYTVAKNMVATVNYFDTEAQVGADDDKVIMSQLYVFF